MIACDGEEVKLLACDDRALLVWRDAFFVVDLVLHIVSGVTGLHIHSDRLAGQSLDEDLKSLSLVLGHALPAQNNIAANNIAASIAAPLGARRHGATILERLACTVANSDLHSDFIYFVYSMIFRIVKL